MVQVHRLLGGGPGGLGEGRCELGHDFFGGALSQVVSSRVKSFVAALASVVRTAPVLTKHLFEEAAEKLKTQALVVGADAGIAYTAGTTMSIVWAQVRPHSVGRRSVWELGRPG